MTDSHILGLASPAISARLKYLSKLNASRAPHGQPARQVRSAEAVPLTSDCSRGRWLSGKADVEKEVTEPQVEYSATSPVHDECQQDDDQNDDHHPEKEHNDAGDCIPRYRSRSRHVRQLPGAT